MRDRIRMIMEAEKMTPARFADSLHIGRAVISHILNGRNNPSLEVITRILTHIPKINSDWLITGSGDMYKSSRTENVIPNIKESKTDQLGLFSFLSENPASMQEDSSLPKYQKENEINKPESNIENVINERIIYKERGSRKIKQIIICYNDNTFETFGDK